MNLEIDDKKIDDPAEISANVDKLLTITQKFLDSIIEHIDMLPMTFRCICKYLYTTVHEKFPEQGFFGVAGFMFLRFICPAIVAPEAYGIIRDKISSKARRTLILVSKVLQNLANGIKFVKEPYMAPTDIFIERVCLPFFLSFFQ